MVSAITVLVAIVICVCLWQHQNDLFKLKRRLAIVEKENLILAKSIKILKSDLALTEEPINQCLKDGAKLLEFSKQLDSLKNSLTLEPAKPKMVPKSKPVNWKSFKSAAEKEAQEEA